MDADTLVENQIDEGSKLLNRLREAGFVFHVACWVKPVDEDRWSLYIASPAVGDMGATAAYREVYRVLRSSGAGWITDSDIKLIGEKHPVAQDALAIRGSFSERKPTRSRNLVLGGIPVEEVYVHPPKEMTPVKVTIYGLIFRDEPSGCLHLSLEPHDPHSMLIIESMGKRKEYRAETGIDWVVAAPAGATLERDEIGQKVLSWDLRGKREQSSANVVWSLANLGLYGFLFLLEPSPTGATSVR